MAQGDMLATVLEEMPPFPERESSILAKLKKKKPAAARVIEEQATEEKKTPKAAPGMIIILISANLVFLADRTDCNLMKRLLWQLISLQHQFKVQQISLSMFSVVQQNQHRLLSNNQFKQLAISVNQLHQLAIIY